MKYSEIVSYPRPWNKKTHPHVAHIEVPAESFGKVERLIDDQTQAKVIGHDLGEHENVVIHVGCTSQEVKDRIESRFA